MRVHRGLLALALVCAAAPAMARDQIIIVGSSTVHPFTTLVIERFARTTGFPAPFSESTGTGGGIDRFCAGAGFETPDLTGASRPIRDDEIDQCRENRVLEITELPIGRDGIVLAGGGTSVTMSLSLVQVFQALAAEVAVDGRIVANPYTLWSQIDPALPEVEIEVFGPPPTSGTRDALIQLAMEPGCAAFAAITALEPDREEEVCTTIRRDGHYVDAGEDDMVIVDILLLRPTAVGVFGFNFLENNADVLTGHAIDGTAPDFDSIASGDYPLSRPLFLYVKNAHIDGVAGMSAFIEEYVSERAIGPEGYLVEAGLVPLTEAERSEARAIWASRSPMIQ